jgi:hypothetical protein
MGTPPKVSKDWLLIKHRDPWARAGESDFGEESIFSGLTVEDLEAGRSPVQRIAEALARLKAPGPAVRSADVGLMLAARRLSARRGGSSS